MAGKKIKTKFVVTMKRNLLILLLIILTSCNNDPTVLNDKGREYHLEIINGHEYLTRSSGHTGYMAHSGECQKCKDQLREIVTECIIKCKNINTTDSIGLRKEVIIDEKKFYVNSLSGELSDDAKEYLKNKK